MYDIYIENTKIMYELISITFDILTIIINLNYLIERKVLKQNFSTLIWWLSNKLIRSYHPIPNPTWANLAYVSHLNKERLGICSLFRNVCTLPRGEKDDAGEAHTSCEAYLSNSCKANLLKDRSSLHVIRWNKWELHWDVVSVLRTHNTF